MMWFFYGQDGYSINAELQKIKKQFSDKHSAAGIEEITVDPDMTDEALFRKLQELFSNLGLFASHKLIICRNFLPDIAKYERAHDFLTASLKNLPREYSVIFTQDQAFDRRLKFFKALQNLAKAEEFSAPVGKGLQTWVKKYLTDHGFEIQQPALEKFTTNLNQDEENQVDLWEITNELEKLMLYCWKERQISLLAVESIVKRAISQNIFSLTNLVADGDIRGAAGLLEQMVSSGNLADSKTQVLQIVGALASQIRNLLLIKEFEGQDAGMISRILKWKEGRVWINLKLAKKYHADKLQGLLKDLLAIDQRLKTSEEPPKLLLTLFFQKAKS